jgi:carbonic anhydrase/acetyltransferase-like protein (isoleucine patch superfamily)
MRHRDPVVAPDAFVASSAVLAGDVRIGPAAVIDHGALIVSTGAPVELGARVAVMPGAVIRSTGGDQRPPHPVRIGDDCLIGPQAALAGCALGAAVYVATQVMVFHGAIVGDGCRLGAGSIVHTSARLPDRTRVGMRQYAVPGPDGVAVVTSDLDEARGLLAAADFFGKVFAEFAESAEFADSAEEAPADLIELHQRSTAAVAAEIRQRSR